MQASVWPALFQGGFRGNSSTSKTIGSFFLPCGTVKGIISSRNRPEAMAAAAFCWEARGKLILLIRVIPILAATFSAVIPILNRP